MDKEQSIYLFQFKKGKQKINRFYINKYINGINPNLYKLLKTQVESIIPVDSSSLENIANIIEINCLEEQFSRIGGIKTCLPSYKKIIGDAFLVEVVNEKGACRILSSKTHCFNY